LPESDDPLVRIDDGRHARCTRDIEWLVAHPRAQTFGQRHRLVDPFNSDVRNPSLPPPRDRSESSDDVSFDLE
jgi:hypothetical protein